MKNYGIFCFLLAVMSLPAAADYRLAPDKSSLNFISVKNAAVTEVHTFSSLSGQVDKQGAASITINLASVETQIPIRNERMAAMLFDTANFADAKISAKVNLSELQALKAGESLRQTLAVELDLHGKKKAVDAIVVVVALAQGGFQVTSAQPVVLKLADFDLLPGVEALQTIANLNSIAVQVPVTFNLVFAKVQ